MIKNKEEKKALVNLLTFLHEKGFKQEEAIDLSTNIKKVIIKSHG